MKKLIYLIFILGCTLGAQEIKDMPHVNCLTRATHSQRMSDNITPEELHVATGAHNQDIDYCITVYAHKLTRTNGSMGVTDAYIATQINYLNNNFGGDFTFVWDGTVNTVANTSIFNTNVISGGGSAPPSYDFNPLDNFSSNDGLDIFFSSRNFGAAGVANGLANHSQIILGPITDVPMEGNSPDSIIHEVGHAFGLFHTYHSTIGNGNNNDENNDGFVDDEGTFHMELVECPSQSQVMRNFTGDFVNDTPADQGIISSVDTTNCIALGQDDNGGGGECDEEFPSISLTNFMKDSNVFHTILCPKEFTPEQYRRMKFFLSNPAFPHMNLLLTDCPDPCDDCQGAQGTLDIINITEVNCDEYELERPFLGNNCGDLVRVFWDINSTEFEEIVNPGNVLSHTYAVDGDYTIKMIVLRDGIICEDVERLIPINVNCDSEPSCPDCDTAGDDILESITLIGGISADSCSTARVTINEDILNCFDVFLHSGQEDTDFVEITSSNLIGNHYFYQYETNGLFIPELILSDPETGINCYENQGDEIEVDCHKPPSCDDCNTLGEQILQSITSIVPISSDTCNNYRMEIPEELFDCYNVYFTTNSEVDLIQITLNDIVNDFYFFNYSENGSFTPFLALINIENGKTCYKNKGANIEVECNEPAICEDCKSAGNQILESISPALIIDANFCSTYRMEIPEELFDCYNVYFTANSEVDLIQITLNDIFNGYHFFSYAESGIFTPFLVLSNIENNKDCFKDKGADITVDCSNDSGCLDCEEVAENIIVVDTGFNCQVEYFVPYGTNECYSILLVFANDHSNVVLELSDGSNFYIYNFYEILIIDNSTGLICSIVTDLPTGVGCIQGNDSTNDEMKLSSHPNPFSSEFYFQDTLERSISKLEIYNSSGIKIIDQDYQLGDILNIGYGAAGLYFAKVYFEDGTIETVQLIKK